MNDREPLRREPRLRARARDELFDAILDELVERIAGRMAESNRHEPEASESWHLLTLVDVAERLGRSERWVRERVKTGDLARIRLDDGAFAFLLEDVIAFAEARRVGGRETLE